MSPQADAIIAAGDPGIFAGGGPIIDGKIIPTTIVEAFKAKKEAQVPYLVGYNSAEFPAKPEDLDASLKGTIGATTADLPALTVTYPDKADNPIHRVAPVLQELTARRWDEGSADFPPTSFQISNIAAGTGANNVIPGNLVLSFNLRFSTAWTSDALRAEVEGVLQRHGLDFDLRWHLSGEPFLTRPGTLRTAVCEELHARFGSKPAESTAGGTSDGRFIAPLGAEVVELGPVNATIHKVNECVSVDAIEALAGIYAGIARRLLVPAA